LHIRMMNLLTQEDFSYLKWLNGRTGNPIELWVGKIWWDDRNKVYTSKVCISVDSDDLVHAYPCIK
jgi:hypothetical protein